MKRFCLIFSVLLGILLSIFACERLTPMLSTDTRLPPISSIEHITHSLTVMTYNVYLGSNADALLSIENLEQVPEETAKMYQNMIASDFPGRATAIAQSIKVHQPHLIGLQDISLIRRQSPSNLMTQSTPDATEVVIDFLAVLMDALHAEGLTYQVAAQLETVDAEMPRFTETGIVDSRLTDYNVLLARSDVAVSRPMSATFKTAFTVEGFDLEIKSGYVAVDATVSSVTYRVVNTNLDEFAKPVRVSQTQELVDRFSGETLPIILLGDFNTPAPDGTAYQLLQSAGYVDLWQLESGGTGNTCCQDENLRNEVSNLSKRSDLIFARNLESLTQTDTFTISERLPSGLWASDHAGVVAHLGFFSFE